MKYLPLFFIPVFCFIAHDLQAGAGGIVQVGPVTAGHAACWVGSQQIKDCVIGISFVANNPTSDTAIATGTHAFAAGSSTASGNESNSVGYMNTAFCHSDVFIGNQNTDTAASAFCTTNTLIGQGNIMNTGGEYNVMLGGGNSITYSGLTYNNIVLGNGNDSENITGLNSTECMGYGNICANETTVIGDSLTSVNSGDVYIRGLNLTTAGLKPVATASLFGTVEPDNTTITISGGVISAVPVATSSIQHGTFASKPSSPSTGTVYIATDIGTGCTIEYTGTKWKPASGSCIISQSSVGWSTTSTTEVNLVAVTIPAGLLSSNGKLRIHQLWNGVNVTGSNTCRTRHNSTSGAITGGTNVGAGNGASSNFDYSAQIYAANATNVQNASSAVLNGAGFVSETQIFNGAIDMTAASYININGYTSAGTTTLASYSVEWLEP